MDALLVCCYIECYSNIFFTDFSVMFCVCVVLLSQQQLDQLELPRRYIFHVHHCCVQK